MMNIEIRQGLNARAIFNGDLYSIKTYSGPAPLIADPSGKHHVLSADCTNMQLGSAVLDALIVSRFVELDQEPDFFHLGKASERYEQWVVSMMKNYGYKTRKALFRKMHNCSIRNANGVMTIRPSYHKHLDSWTGDGITAADYVIIPDNSSPEEIGAALRLAFSRCKGKMF